MSAKMNITVNVPDKLILAAGIDENTVFECYFEDGAIHILSLSDKEVTEISRENICVTENHGTDDLADCRGVGTFVSISKPACAG